MSLSDIIISIFKKHGSLSSKEVKEILEQEYNIKRNLRTIQRHIQALLDNGKVIPEKSLGREQKYSLQGDTNKKTEISGYLIKRFWREEEEIEKEVIYGELFRAYRKAELLWLKLPSPYKQKLTEHFKTANASLQNIKTQDPYFRGVQQLKLLRNTMPIIIERLASILYEMEGKEEMNQQL